MDKIRGLLYLVPLLCFLGFFFYWPLFNIFKIAIEAGIPEWKDTITYPLFSRFFQFTFFQAIYTVVGSLAIGAPTGYLLARSELYGSRFLRAAVTVPFLFPPLVILLGFVLLFEPSGLVSDFISGWSASPFSYWGIVFAHTLYNISLVARITEGGFSTEPDGYHHVADSLGAGAARKFWTITLPHLKPSLLSAILLTFLYSYNSFAIVLILGEVKLQTLEVMIYAQSRLRFNIARAAILSVIQLFVNIVVIVIYSRQSDNTTIYESTGVRPKLSSRIIPTALVCLVVILTWLPVFMVFKYTADTFFSVPQVVIDQLLSSSYDRFLGTSSSRVLGNTLFFGIVVSTLSVGLSLSAIVSSYLSSNVSLEKITAPLILLPMGTSAITTSFAILQTHGQFSFFTQFVYIYIISAQLIAALPFASRAIFSSWERIPQDLLLVSHTLGGSEFYTFRKVILPFLKSSLLVAFLFSFAISIGEFGSTYYLARGEWTTLSLAIKRLFGSRTTLLPNLYASFLVLFSLVLFWIIEKMGKLELRV